MKRMRSNARVRGLVCGLLACSVAACGAVDDERTAEQELPIHTNNDENDVSQSVYSSRTVSVAISDGAIPAGTSPVKSDVVIGYEDDGFSAWAYGEWQPGLNVINWQPPGHSSSWTPPSSMMSDGHPFGHYEGAPTVLSFNTAPQSQALMARRFWYVGKAGSTQNGTKGLIQSASTDVVAIGSSNGGLSWGTPRILTSATSAPPGGRLRVDYPTAAVNLSGATISAMAFTALWREIPVDQQGNQGTATWKMRWVNASLGNVEQNTHVVPIPSDVVTGPARIALQNRLGDEAKTDVYVVYPTYDDQPSVCPDNQTVSVAWKMISTTFPYGATWSAPETIATNSAWRKCVGGSSLPGGTAWNRHQVRPELALDPVTNTLYVAMSENDSATSGARVRVYRKSPGGSWTMIFTTSSPTAPYMVDDWSPALSVYHYPGEPHAQVGLIWYSTRGDTTSATHNEYIQVYAAISETSGNTWDPIAGYTAVNMGGVQLVHDFLGSYQGIAAHPRLGGPSTTAGFVAGWGDQRSAGGTNVYATTIYAN